MTSSLSMRIAAALGVAALGAGALVGCGGDSTPADTGTAAATTATTAVDTATSDASTATVTDANGATETESTYRPDSGTVINETLGATFAVELSQSPSTGYAWKPAGGTAASLVELIDQDTETEGDAPGSPGTITFAYRASAEGSGTLVFDEFAPGSQKASDTVTFEVSVGAP